MAVAGEVEKGVRTARSRLRRLALDEAHHPARSAFSGFTLPELIAVLLILAALSVFVIPRLDSLSGFGERADYDRVFSSLEYARKAAVAQRRYVCVQVAASSLTFTVNPSSPESTSFGGACSAALPMPTRDSGCGTNQTCVSSITLSGPSFQFDPLGRASSGAVPQTAPLTLAVTGYSIGSITIESDTGYVH